MKKFLTLALALMLTLCLASAFADGLGDSNGKRKLVFI